MSANDFAIHIYKCSFNGNFSVNEEREYRTILLSFQQPHNAQPLRPTGIMNAPPSMSIVHIPISLFHIRFSIFIAVR